MANDHWPQTVPNLHHLGRDSVILHFEIPVSARQWILILSRHTVGTQSGSTIRGLDYNLAPTSRMKTSEPSLGT